MGCSGTRIALVVACICLSGIGHSASAEVRAKPGMSTAKAERHALDPLTSEEIVTAATTLRKSGRMSPDSKFSQLSLNEPGKEKAWSSRQGVPLNREATVTVFDRLNNKTIEAVVDLDGKKVKSWTEIERVQPGLMAADLEILERAVRSDNRWQEAMQKRGISDLEAVHVDAWPASFFGFQDEEGIREGFSGNMPRIREAAVNHAAAGSWYCPRW